MAIGLIHSQSFIPTTLNKTVVPTGLGITAAVGTPAPGITKLPTGFGLTASRGTPVVTTGQFFAPNIAGPVSVDTGTPFSNGYTNWSLGTPDGITVVSVAPPGYTKSITATWAPNAAETTIAHCIYDFYGDAIGKPGVDAVYYRCFLRMTGNVTSNYFKFHRFKTLHFGNYGGFWLAGDCYNSATTPHDGIAWGFDTEDGAIVTSLGISEAMAFDGNWHCLECYYDRNIGPSPNVTVWWDNVKVFRPNGSSGGGSSNPNGHWLNGTLYAGERNDSSTLGWMEYYSICNAQTASGQVWSTGEAWGTNGRIGPNPP